MDKKKYCHCVKSIIFNLKNHQFTKDEWDVIIKKVALVNNKMEGGD